jgi:methylphosphotriester-DNA--protein-cysteine methyltransferase
MAGQITDLKASTGARFAGGGEQVSQVLNSGRRTNMTSATGFRPCKRCNFDRPSVEDEKPTLVTTACRKIAESEEELSLGELAAAVGRSASYFHRVFKVATCLTPKD